MLYYSFYNYQGFKEVFGIVEHGNGNVSRRNKILLSMMKDKQFFNAIRTAPLKMRWANETLTKEQRENIIKEFRSLQTMSALRMLCIRLFGDFKPLTGWDCNLKLDNDEYLFAHDEYSIDNGGLCYDGDFRSVRYINHENDDHTYKMRAGKFFRRLVDASPWSILPESVKVWLAEDFTERWQSYAQSKTGEQKLHISTDAEDFQKIYDSANYDGDFGSCMSHDGGDHSSFYAEAVKAKAAWLENSRGKITARCVIFTDAKDKDGKTWRLAERQYSTEGDNILKRLLVDKLIEAGEIDAYKQVGVDCHNSRAWVANDGTSLSDVKFSIECNLDDDDVMSYMDSFKWYDYNNNIAYNYDNCNAHYRLDETDLYFRPHEGRVWSDYENEWIDEDDAVYVDTRDDYFYSYDTRWCTNTHSNEFCADCVQLGNGDYAYYGHECKGYEGVYYCDNCNEYFLEDDMDYSELLDEYLCHDCRYEREQEYMEEHKADGRFRYDVYDEEWYDTEEYEDVRVLYWDYDQHRRRVGYTRKNHVIYRTSSFVRYHNNWYYSNIVWDGDIRVPREKVVA